MLKAPQYPSQDEAFCSNLMNLGAFVRDYDELTVERLGKAAKLLYRELSQLDGVNSETWNDITVYQLINAWLSTPRGSGGRMQGPKPHPPTWRMKKEAINLMQNGVSHD